MSKKKSPQPQRVFYNVGRRIPQCQLYGRLQTAIGIEPLSQWAEGEIFYGSFEQLQDHYLQLQEQKETAVGEQRERDREAARAREPKSCPRILSASDLAELRGDPELIAMCSGEPVINEVYKPLWVAHPSEFFVSRLFDDNDLVRVIHAYGGPEVKRFDTIKKHLDAYSSIAANPLAVGEAPKRKRIVVRFSTSQWKRLSFLARNAELQMLVCGAGGGLDCWFNCSGWKPSKLIKFAEQAIKLGGEITEQAYMPNGPATSLNGAVYEFLHRGGFLRDREQHKPKNFTLHFAAPNAGK